MTRQKSKRTRQKNKRQDMTGESNDSPEILDWGRGVGGGGGGVTFYIPSLPSGVAKARQLQSHDHSWKSPIQFSEVKGQQLSSA